MEQQGGIAAVVDDQLRSQATGELERLPGAPPIFLERLALPGVHRNSSGGDRRGGMVLGREDVAGNPAHLGTEIDQGFDQHRGLDRHVQRTHHAHALQWLLRTILGAGGHQAGHLVLGDLDFLAAEIGQADVANFVVGEAHVCFVLDRSDRSDPTDSSDHLKTQRTAFFSASALSVRSQVRSASSLPKWP